jgi:hypothetical protein
LVQGQALKGKIIPMTTMKLRSGDKVRIIGTAFDCSTDVVDIVVATKGSIATVLSYDEYHNFVRKNQKVLNVDAAQYLADLSDRMGEGKAYPIRIEEFVPYEVDDPRIFVECSVGYITTLEVRFLEKIDQQISLPKK